MGKNITLSEKSKRAIQILFNARELIRLNAFMTPYRAFLATAAPVMNFNDTGSRRGDWAAAGLAEEALEASVPAEWGSAGVWNAHNVCGHLDVLALFDAAILYVQGEKTIVFRM